MTTAVSLLLVPLLWFLVSAAVLFLVTRVYVHVLLAIAGFPRLRKVVLGAALWLGFAAAVVAPLFGWLSIARAHFPRALDFPVLVWPLLCFGLCFIAVYRPIKRHLPQLRAAGFYRK